MAGLDPLLPLEEYYDYRGSVGSSDDAPPFGYRITKVTFSRASSYLASTKNPATTQCCSSIRARCVRALG